MKTEGIDKFSKRLDEIFDQGMPTKTQIIDAYNKFAQQPSSMGDYKCHVETSVKDSKGNPVFVDKCLKEAIELLNEHGFKTIASCCGHCKISPTILIEQSQPEQDELQAYHLNCDTCGKPYWSINAFPKPQWCEKCVTEYFNSSEQNPTDKVTMHDLKSIDSDLENRKKAPGQFC